MQKTHFNILVNQRRKELGGKPVLACRSNEQGSLASCLGARYTWDPRKTVDHSHHGGVFNFDFSKDGSILGVACERKSILLFDPFNGKLVAHRNNAHTDCVNCVRFLDNRLFATCSDDTTVALWDTRYLKHKVHVFTGHSNWVKNIEYASDQGLLVTSGFDGCIYTWNIDRYSEEESSNRVFYTNGLMRSKLSPDNSKLLISTHEGYIIIIHDLDLSTLAEDLNGFKPNMYRLMQRSQTPLRIGLLYNHVFEQKRNRVEFLADWPTGNDANIVSSLQIHPQGWCALSRNTNSDENTEWTCVHDIQDDDESWKDTRDTSHQLSVVNPHTSSSYCSATNTPAFSSVAPSNPTETSSSGDTSTPSGTELQDTDAASAPTAGGVVLQSVNIGADAGAAGVAGAGEATQASPDSLISIRRGARMAQGQFSFTISIHTSSGRTIELNNSDFDSDEEGLNTLPPVEPVDTDTDDSESEYEDDFYENPAPPESLGAGSSWTSTLPSTSHVPVASSSSLSTSSVTSSQQSNTITSPVVTISNENLSLSNLVTAPLAPSTESSNVSSVRLGVDNAQGGQARTNTFTFVLQSNNGRRILNLRYMDSYTEQENNVLKKKIYQNKKRLVAFAEECNVGRGFIKELGFSSDGRFICSPFGFGVRLFGFDSHCNELCDCVPSSPVKLYEVACSLAHGNCVVASKFSPTHFLLVTGCLDGRIAFHQPIL